MNWLVEIYEKQRHEEAAIRAQREAEIQALLDAEANNADPKGKKLRRAVGGKMVEWGERLQDSGSLAPSRARP